MVADASAFFALDKEVFLGLDPARGPWSPDHCHAGPVSGLIARAVEAMVGAEKVLTRLTIDLLRPVPLHGIRVEAQLVRNGRTVATATAVVKDLDERICASATSMHLTRREIGDVPTTAVPPLSLADARREQFPIKEIAHDKPAFGHFIETAYPPGETTAPGPTTMWMKTLPLLANEEMSSFQRLCPLADCGNALSRNAELSEIGFMNTDLTIVAYRQTASDWLASSSVSYWHSNGLGLAKAIIQDEDGVIAVAVQTLILTPN